MNPGQKFIVTRASQVWDGVVFQYAATIATVYPNGSFVANFWKAALIENVFGDPILILTKPLRPQSFSAPKEINGELWAQNLIPDTDWDEPVVFPGEIGYEFNHTGTSEFVWKFTPEDTILKPSNRTTAA